MATDVQVKIYNSRSEFARDAASMAAEGWAVTDVNRRVSRGDIGRVKPAAFPNRRNGSGGTRGDRVIVTYTLGYAEDELDDFEDDESYSGDRDKLLG